MKGVICMGQILRIARVRAGLTQAELAERSGISRVTINMIENNVSKNIKSSTMLAIANALDCSVDDIFFATSVKSI